MKKPFRISSISDVIGSLIHSMKLESRMEHIMLRDVWDDAVGERIAEKTSPASLRGGILFVHVASAVWVQELTFLKGKILQKINSRLADSKLKDIRFKAGPVSARERRVAVEPLPPLHEGDRQQIEQEAGPIDDPELREAFKELRGAFMKNKRQAQE